MLDRTIREIIGIQTLVRLSPHETVAEAAHAMTLHRVGALLIFDDNDALCGILTDRDMLDRVVAPARDPAATTVEEVMTRDPVTIPATATGLHALRAMNHLRARHLPVIDPSGIVGIASVRDLLRAAVDDLARDQGRVDDLWEGFPV